MLVIVAGNHGGPVPMFLTETLPSTANFLYGSNNHGLLSGLLGDHELGLIHQDAGDPIVSVVCDSLEVRLGRLW